MSGTRPGWSVPLQRPMPAHEELARASPHGDTVLTIGTFDGVHLGHQHLLGRLCEIAAQKGLVPLVLTFRNHPRTVLNPGLKLHYISTVDERVELIHSLGVEVVVPLDFTLELSRLRAREFVSMLGQHLRMKGLVVGPDFALGHRREGDLPTLRRLGEEMDFWVEPVEPILLDGRPVKSSQVRSMIGEGDVESLSRMLGRHYSLSGTVVEGDRRGRTLGFPTANLTPLSGVTVPANGIYATWALMDGHRYQAATSIGVRPTFGENVRTVEAFILDFQRDIYGAPLTLEFVQRLRDEVAFSSVEALVEQMNLDVEQARLCLSNPLAPLRRGATGGSSC